MAKRLDAAGEEVGLLALVDPRVAVPRGPTYVGWQLRLGGRKVVQGDYGWRLALPVRQKEVWGAAARELRARFTSLDRRAPAERKFEQRIRAIRRTLVPSTIRGRVNVYVSLDWPLREWFWEPLVEGELVLEEIPCRHTAVLRAPGSTCWRGTSAQPCAQRRSRRHDEGLARSEEVHVWAVDFEGPGANPHHPACGGSSAATSGKTRTGSASFAGPAGSRRSPSLGRGSGSTSRTRARCSRRAGRRPRGGNRRREARFRAGLGGDRRHRLLAARGMILRPLLEPARTRAFFSCWTRKEACAKATGEGVTALERLDVLGRRRVEGLWLSDLDVGDGYAAALAVTASCA